MLDYKIGIFIALSACFFVYIHSAGVGSTCFQPSDCGLYHFICENNICKCDKDHIPDRDNKYCAVDILKPCGYHDTCFDIHAECVDVAWPKWGSCQCNAGYTLNEKKVCSSVIGNNCTLSEDCIEGTCLMPPESCTTGRCNETLCFCNGVLQPNINGTKCLPALGDECSAYGECAREHSVCRYNTAAQKKICECGDTYKETERNETTYCLAMLDNTCKNATDCADEGAACVPKNETESSKIRHSHGFDNRHSYKKNRHSYLYNTKDTYWPEEPIPEPTKYCVCDTGYVRHPEVSTCLKVATALNDNCTENIQCTTYSGFGSVCNDGVCACKDDFYFDIDFKRCVRSCLCPSESKVQDMIDVFQELKPTLEFFAENNKIDVSGLLKKIDNLLN